MTLITPHSERRNETPYLGMGIRPASLGKRGAAGRKQIPIHWATPILSSVWRLRVRDRLLSRDGTGRRIMLIDDADWPLFGWATDIRPVFAEARDHGQAVVLATLVRTVGPAPRPVGSQMVFRGSRADGYFSGGCLEADVANHAAQVAETGAPRRLVYGEGSPWIDIRLLCGGAIEILLERIDPDDAAVGALLRLSGQREQVLWSSDGVKRHAQADDSVRPAAFDGSRYCLSYTPNWRMLVVGGDPIALAIASLAAMSGFGATLVRPLGPTRAPPIAGVAYFRGPLVQALAEHVPDRWTAIVTATHDDAIDDEVLTTAAGYPCAYVGVLGSVRRVPARRQRLGAAGLSDDQLEAIRAPIGAARCGKGPWEVAVSVIAEIMQLRRSGIARGREDRPGDAGTHAAIERAT